MINANFMFIFKILLKMASLIQWHKSLFKKSYSNESHVHTNTIRPGSIWAFQNEKD